jgi:excisionase family DNA binding protein
VNASALPDDYLTPKEAAPRLKRSVRTLARMRAEGRGPKYHREGGLVLYPQSALYEWLAQFVTVPPRSSM